MNSLRFILSFLLFALSLSLASAQTADPFAPENQRPADAEKKAAPTKETPAKGPAKKSAISGLIDFEVKVEPATVRRGQTAKLTITGKVKEGFYTYSFSKKTADQLVPGKDVGKLDYEKAPGLQPLWPMTESPPHAKTYESLGETKLIHTEPFTLTQDILVLEDAPTGELTLPIKIELGVCKTTCSYGAVSLESVIKVSDEPPVVLTAELKERMKVAQPEPEVVQPGQTDNNIARTSGGGADSGLLAFILAGIFWGAVSLITPCVFPMIPITVSYFLKQSEKEHHRPIGMAVVYCTTIVVVLTIAAVAMLSFFRALSTNPAMNIAIGGLFIFFALSLFGWYEIELPTGLARFTSSREGKGGMIGTIFMALTFTIISFACVAPFLGGFGGTAANSGITFAHRILGGLAFSITFASPFFILALFPTLLKRVPKSGAWLNTVKVVMGFLELAAAFKFLRSGELVLLPQPVLFTYDFVLGLYVAISLLCGLYLLGVYRLPHDSPLEHLSVPRLLFSFAFLGLAFYLTPALFKTENGQNQRPSGAVFAWLDSFLLPEEQESDLPWSGDLNRALAEAKDGNRLVFVDFTGVTCTNCKLNERNVFSKSAVRDLLKKYELVALYTDVVPNKFYSEKEQQELGAGTGRQRADAVKNLEFQREKFNTEELPLYVVLRPKGNNGEFEEVDRFDEGLIRDEANFLRFLQQPLAGAAITAQVARD